MGNVLGTAGGAGREPGDRGGGAAIPWNISEAGPINDLNYPHSSQMFYFVLHGMIPLIGVCLFAYTAKRYEKDRRQMENTCVNLNQFMSSARRQTDANSSTKTPLGSTMSKNDTLQLLEKLESDENRKMSRKMSKLQTYDQELEKILDIRCSLFKRHRDRDILQRKLVADLTRPDNPLHDLDVYNGLTDIFRYDYLFCGQAKKDNGKFRQLYVRNWKLETELNKHKAIIERLKMQLKS
ncbi:uncharacterized protein LOC141910088 [Tubulanus polymorphus]|uniref:uncharacterized protein LOC141910088 n=1 Tax=Tubulanus polymorphus TaxID=672921 RepID=UPI003DA6C1BE